MSFIFNGSFRDCQVPTAWKTALIVPVHKGGSKSLLSNYRPIALLNVVSKLIKKIVHQRLEQFLQPVLSSKQSGFKKGDGVHLQLARLLQEWSLAIGSGYMVGVVFFDIKIACGSLAFCTSSTLSVFAETLSLGLKASSQIGANAQWLAVLCQQ